MMNCRRDLVFYKPSEKHNWEHLEEWIELEGEKGLLLMFQSTQDIDDSAKGDDDIKLQRAWMEGKLCGMDVVVVHYNEMLFTGNVLDVDAEGVRLEFVKI